MKKFIPLFFMFLFIIPFLVGCRGTVVTTIVAEGELISRDVAISGNINAIDILGVFDVTVSIGDVSSVSMYVQDNIWEITQTSFANSTFSTRLQRGLFISFSQAERPRIHITTPSLTSATLGGVTIVNLGEITRDSFILNTSGNSKVEMSFYGRTLNVYASNTSKIDLSGEAQHLIVSTAGNAELNAENFTASNNLTITASNTSAIATNFVGQNATIHASGNSHINLSGTAQFVSVTASNTANLQALYLIAQEYIINGSNATRFYVHATDSIGGTLSNSSRVTYCGSPVVNVVTSGTASIVAR